MAASSTFEGEIYGDSENEEEKETKTDNTNKDATTTTTVEFDVEKLEPSPAFQRFSGRVAVDGTQVDANRIKDLAEVIDDGNKKEAKFEYPLQKYTRLKDEDLDLEKQLKQLVQLAETNGEDPTRHVISQVNQDIKQMWGNAEQLTNNPYLTPLLEENDPSSSKSTILDSKYLLKRLQELDVSSSSDKNKSSPASGQTQLTLYHDGTMDNRWNRLKDIAQRLETLETLLGPTPENMSNAKGGMTRNVEHLFKRLELLCDSNKLSTLKKRADSLKESLKEIKIVPQNVMEEQIIKSKEHKINQMFEMMERWDQASQSLPAVVSRLRALHNLNQESADMLHKVNGLESQQHLIEQTLNENTQLLQQVNQSLAENSKAIQANVQSIENRIAQLQQQVQKL